MGQQNSRAVLDVLFPQSGMQGRMKQTALDGKISGEVMDLPAGPMSFAAGYDLRHEQSVITPTDNVLQGDIVGLGALQTNAARTFGAVYGELDIPVVKPLDLQLAARADKFPGFGTHLSPKVGVRFQPTKDLLLRATAEGGFRAPNLSEAAPSKKVAFESVADPQRCDGAQRYASDLRAQAAGLPDTDPRKVALQVQAEQVANNECAAGVASVVNDNPALKPEVSHGYSLGLLFEPLPDTSFSLDYWAMDRKDEIGVKSTADVLAQEGALPFGVAVYRAPLTADRSFPTPELQQRYGITAGPITGVLNRFENISRTRTSGIDFAAKGRVGTRAGMLDLGLMGTHLNRFLSYSPVLGGYGDNLAGRYGFPRWSATASAALTSGAFLNGLQLTYSSGMSLQGDYYDTQWNPQGCAANLNLSPDQCRVAAYVRTDYFFSYTGFRNLTLSAHVSNLFNRLPPLDRRALDAGGYKTPQLEEAQRRTLQISLDYRFR
jgi:iron complex outermembrane receptor protein